MSDQILENITVELDGISDGWIVLHVIPISKLPFSASATSYLLLKIPEPAVAVTFAATLKFQVKDVDPTTGEPEGDEFYDDSFVVFSSFLALF